MKKKVLAIVCVVVFILGTLTACGNSLDLNCCSGNAVGNGDKYHNTYLTMHNGRMEIGDYHYRDDTSSPSGISSDNNKSHKYYFDYTVDGNTLTVSDDEGNSASFEFELGKNEDGRELITFKEDFFGFGTNWAMVNDEEAYEISETGAFFPDDNIHHSLNDLNYGSGAFDSISGYYIPYSEIVTYPGGTLNGGGTDYSRISLDIDGSSVTLKWYAYTFYGTLSPEGGNAYAVDWAADPALMSDSTYLSTKIYTESDGGLEMVMDYDHNGVTVSDHVYYR